MRTARPVASEILGESQLQHRGDVVAVFLLESDGPLVLAQIVLAIGHAQAALQEVPDVPVRVCWRSATPHRPKGRSV